MGACTSEQDVKMNAIGRKSLNDNSKQQKATIKEDSIKLVSKEGSQLDNGGRDSQNPVQQKCVKHQTVKTSVHEHALERVRDFMEPWLCSGATESDGCQSDSPEFQPGMQTKTWVCQDCVYFMCKPCLVHYQESHK